MAETLEELAEFLHNVEFVHLQQKQLLATLQEQVTAQALTITSLEADRDTTKKRLDAVERAPADAAKELDAMEKRLTVVEGAVGSAGLKAAKAHK